MEPETTLKGLPAMMARPHELPQALCRALGLDPRRVRRLTIDCDAERAEARVRFERFPSRADVSAVAEAVAAGARRCSIVEGVDESGFELCAEAEVPRAVPVENAPKQPLDFWLVTLCHENGYTTVLGAYAGHAEAVNEARKIAEKRLRPGSAFRPGNECRIVEFRGGQPVEDQLVSVVPVYG